MANIATLHSFGGSANPIGSGEGFTASGGTFKELGGAAVPNDFGVDSTLDWATAWTETTNPTKGYSMRLTVGGGCEQGTVLHLRFDVVDANNYSYVKIEFGGIQLYSDLYNDKVSLWQVTAGVAAQIQGKSGLRYLQEDPGDLRHYQLVAGSAITLIKVYNQLIVKFTAHDTIDGYDWNTDIIVLREDYTPATTTGKTGFTHVGGSDTTTISLWQGELTTAYFRSASGDDANNGRQAAPFATFKKLRETVDAGQIGFLSGNFSENLSNTTSSLYKNGTSYQDAPTFLPLAGEAITQTNNGGSGSAGIQSFTSTSRVPAVYQVFCGWTIDAGGVAGSNKECVRMIGQIPGDDTTHVNKYMRFQEITGIRATGGACFSWHHQTYYDGGATYNSPPTSSTYDTRPHYIDCIAKYGDNGAASPAVNNAHGYYLNDWYITMDYCQSMFHRGAPGKFAHGTSNGPFGLGVQVVNHCRNRFFYAYRCGYGWNSERGANNVFGSMFEEMGYKENGTPWGENIAAAFGCAILMQSNDARIIASIAINNYYAGFMIDAVNIGTVLNSKFINLTAYGNHYNYTIRTQNNTTKLVDNTLFMNCSAYAATNRWSTDAADYKREGAFDTNTTFTTNHETASTGFGSVFGNPLFLGPGSKNFGLQEGSPLEASGSDASAYHSVDYKRKPLPQSSWHIGAIAPSTPVGLIVDDPGGTPHLQWAAKSGVAKTRIFVEWSGNKRWWEALDDPAGGVKSNGTGPFNVISASPVQLPASTVKFSIRQYDGSGVALENETAQIEWDNS